MMTPGGALIALRAHLAGCGLEVTGITITRLYGIMPLAGGPVVRYCCGWLAWSAGLPAVGAAPCRPCIARMTRLGPPGGWPLPRCARTDGVAREAWKELP